MILPKEKEISNKHLSSIYKNGKKKKKLKRTCPMIINEQKTSTDSSQNIHDK